ncbi:MAG: DHHW family protein, partial [Bacillota bacterium]
MRKRMADLVLIGFLLIFMFGFGIWTWIKDDEKVSTLENRKLNKRPDATVDRIMSGEYFKRFEDYFNDQFPGRQFFIEANGILDKYIFQKDVTRSIYVHD